MGYYYFTGPTNPEKEDDVTTLASIIPPHEVRDGAKLAALIAAYQNDESVPPVTVLVFADGEARAVNGSHRIAAALEVYEEDVDVSDSDGLGWTVLDGNEVYEQASEDGRRMLDDMLNSRGLDFDEMVAELGL